MKGLRIGLPGEQLAYARARECAQQMRCNGTHALHEYALRCAPRALQRWWKRELIRVCVITLPPPQTRDMYRIVSAGVPVRACLASRGYCTAK